MAASIEDYGFLGDLHTGALVSREGSVDWLCLPRFDSPACFAALLDAEKAGRWLLAPAGGGRCTRRSYRGDALVLDSEWDTPGGTVRVTDCMPPRGEVADLVRIVTGISGRVSMRMELRLRFDYGRVVPWVRKVGDQLVATAGPDTVWLRTPVELVGQHMTTTAEFDVQAGQTVPFVLTHTLSHRGRPRPIDAGRAVRDTEAFWTDWVSRGDHRGPYPGAVRRSLVLLKALTYAPTGGIVAAATTSLPEQLGGQRNWDYRYCWLRDATLTLQALLGAGYLAEARAWREWLLRAVAGQPADLQSVYGLDGGRWLPEYPLPWLSGYRGARPVRVGNAAAGQFQLDVWGEVLNGLHRARRAAPRNDEPGWDLQRALANYLEGHWQDPDNSLWEMRGQRRDFVHSKVMAWVGMDRAVQAVETIGLTGPADRWRAVRQQIRTDVLDKGFDTDRGTFTQFYGSHGLDAALLLIPRVGFLPPTDPRVVGTIEAIQRELTEGGLVLRYRPDADDADGLPGGEGAFLACSFWLADALHGAGRTEQARVLFERLLTLRNDLGILAEGYDTTAGRQLGNTPHASSHVALINTARNLTDPAPGTVPAG